MASVNLRWPGGISLAGLAWVLGGCAATLHVQPLATGRNDMAAYALTGADLDMLRREAQRLCPLGGDILRQAGAHQRMHKPDSRWRAALTTAARWADPPDATAQLMVLCRQDSEHNRISASAPKPAKAETAAETAVGSVTVQPSDVPAAMPVGPTTAQW